MGATASRSSSPTLKKTSVVRIYDYSELTRVPLDHPRVFDSIFFNDLYWDVTAKPMSIKDGQADGIILSVVVSDETRYRSDLVLKGIDISIEILDETGKNTVFREDSYETTLQYTRRLLLYVERRSLEASSCVHNDGFTVRCTLSRLPATNWWCLLFSKSKEVAAVLEPPQDVAMAGSNTLTIHSFSKIKATLQNQGCAYSTHFAVGGCRWYFNFSPAGSLAIFRASNDDSPTTAEFSFELEGVVNFESEKMTHTFDDKNSRYIYRFSLEPNTSDMHDDRLIVRCRLAVITVENLSLTPTAITAVEKISQKLMVEKPSMAPTTATQIITAPGAGPSPEIGPPCAKFKIKFD